MQDLRTDPELIAQSRAGNADAFGVLWQRHQPAAWRAARALTSDRTAADDAIAETFGATFAALGNGAGPDVHFRAYLLTSLRNNVARTQRQASNVISTDAIPEVAVVDEPDTGGDERAAAVEAYESLPERYRAVLWHAEIEQEPMAVVAQAIGTTSAAAAQLLVRARRHLRRAYVQAHINHSSPVDATPECNDARAHMGAYFTGTLAARDLARLEGHLPGCEECRKILAWAEESGAGLRAFVVPAVLGSAASGKYLAGKSGWLGAHAVATRASLAARHLTGHAAAHPAGAGVAASVAAVAVAASVIGGHGLLSAHSQPRADVGSQARSAVAASPGRPGGSSLAGSSSAGKPGGAQAPRSSPLSLRTTGPTATTTTPPVAGAPLTAASSGVASSKLPTGATRTPATTTTAPGGSTSTYPRAGTTVPGPFSITIPGIAKLNLEPIVKVAEPLLPKATPPTMSGRPTTPTLPAPKPVKSAPTTTPPTVASPPSTTTSPSTATAPPATTPPATAPPATAPPASSPPTSSPPTTAPPTTSPSGSPPRTTPGPPEGCYRWWQWCPGAPVPRGT